MVITQSYQVIRMYTVQYRHRRRIDLEDKAKVVDRLFQKGRGKTASAARNLFPNPTRRPLPCLLNIISFFYEYRIYCKYTIQYSRSRIYCKLHIYCSICRSCRFISDITSYIIKRRHMRQLHK